MALVNGTNYDHIDLHSASGGDVTRHKLQDTEARAMMAPTESSSTASAAHAAGSYFIYNNTLYQATADIASGGTITPNTNCKAVTVGGEVSDLKSALVYITGNSEYESWIGPKKYINLSGATADIANPSTASGNCQCMVVPASEGDTFTISCTGGGGSRAYGFVAGSEYLTPYAILEVAGVSVTLTKQVVVAPPNTAYLVVNDTTYAGHVFAGITVDARIADINNAIGDTTQILPKASGYINTSGTSVSLTPTSNSSYINTVLDCSPGDAFTVTATGGSSALPYVFIDSSNNIIEKAASNALSGKFIVAPTGTAKVVFNCLVASTHLFYHGYRTINKIITNILAAVSEIEGDTQGLLTAVGDHEKISVDENGYINTSGASTDLTVTSSTSFKHKVLSCAEGDIFTVESVGGTAALPYAFIDSSGNFLEKAPSSSMSPAVFIIAPKNANKVIFNVSAYSPGSEYYYGFKTVNGAIGELFKEKNRTETRKTNIFRVYDNIVCIGDSLTYSQVYNAAGTARQAFVPYPDSVEKITGTPTAYYATPGYTCKQWWNQYNSNITGSNKLYIIYLGTNDVNEDDPMTDTVATDCIGDDPSQYADSPCGYYGRIIRTIQTTGSRCVLIKIGLGSAGDNANAAIVSLGNRFSVPVIENPQYILADDYYHYGDLNTTYKNTVHLNDLGYERFAEYVVDTINELPLTIKYALMPKGT